MKILFLIFGVMFFVDSMKGEYECTIYAGTGVRGYSGDGGAATNAQVNNPYGVIRIEDGTVYFCDTDNHVVRKVKNGIITTVAGNGIKGYSGDGDAATKATLNEPYEVRLNGHDLYFVERMNHLIRALELHSGKIQTVAGNGKPGFAGDGESRANAVFTQPHSIQFNAEGELFICDIGNHRLRKIRGNQIYTIGGTGQRTATTNGAELIGNPLNGPRAVDFSPDGTLWLALREGNAIYRVKKNLEGELRIHHVAGTGKAGKLDGPAAAATLSGPKGIAVGPEGDVYFADTESHSIRKIEVKSGKVITIAGTGKRGGMYSKKPLEVEMNRPHGIYVDAKGNILIGDSENHRVLELKKVGL